MNFFSRLKRMWIGLWSKLLSNQEEANPHLLIEGGLKEARAKVKKLQSVLHNLHFHSVKLESKRRDLNQKVQDLSEKLEITIRKRDDNLSLQIIKEIEKLKEKDLFFKEELEQITRDQEAAKKSFEEYQLKIENAEVKLRSLGDKITSLKLRKELKTELDEAQGNLSGGFEHGLTEKLTDQALKLETELSSYKNPSVDEKIRDLDHQISIHRQEKILKDLKTKMGLIRPMEIKEPAL